MKHAYAVIMAGGSGTRFWPLSRKARPKQFLALGPHRRSLLQATAERVAAEIPPARTLVVTSKALAAAVREDLPQLPEENILAEPVGRNTAPCIGWAAAYIRRRDPRALLAVLPADHYIGDRDAYMAALRSGLQAAEHGDLVTIGIRPSRPETGYGYIEVGEELDPGVHRARRFVEKPNPQRAQQFVTSGRFLWNSGMFFFSAERILEAIAAHLPGLSSELKRYDRAAADSVEQAALDETYGSLPSISIDHGVMEKADAVSVIPSDFEWSDLGSWTSAWELAERDAGDNVLPSDAVAIDSSGTYVSVPEGKLVALVGVKDLVVVDSGDALLVVPRSRSQEVRDIVSALEERKDPKR